MDEGKVSLRYRVKVKCGILLSEPYLFFFQTLWTPFNFKAYSRSSGNETIHNS